MSLQAGKPLLLPDGRSVRGVRLALHACCAPCAGAVVERLLMEGAEPVVFFSNANIYPQAEYALRRAELERFLIKKGVAFVEDDYDHASWLAAIAGLEHEPERGRRCEACFRFRLHRAARWAQSQGLAWLTTTLASSRWKSLPQVDSAGAWACEGVEGVSYWPRNWRKEGLQQRRSEIIREEAFYNQQYCGCEFAATIPAQ